MLKKKSSYKFNPELLDFVKVEFSYDELFRKLFTYSFISVIIGFVVFLFLFNTIDSPSAIIQQNINEKLKLKYELLEKRTNGVSFELARIQHNDNKMYRPYFESKEIPNSVRLAGFGGTDRYQKFQSFVCKDMLIKKNIKMDLISKQLYIQSVSFDELTSLIKNKGKMLSSIPAIQPVRNKAITAFGPFGMRMHPILRIYRLHAGVDLCAPLGTPIYASGDGYVAAAKFGRGGIGYYIRINHGYGYNTVYGHLSKMLVKPGQRVNRGDVIALMGTTGISNVSHLHYEVHKNGRPVDPTDYYFDDLSDDEYQRMVQISTEKLNSDFD